MNKLWIKFFLTAVFSTMWIRDHQRPEFHKALGVDPAWYGQEVFRKTSDISRQVFPMVLDIDHPRWQPMLNRLQDANVQIVAGRKQGGVGGWFKRMGGTVKAGLTFVSLLTIPVVKSEVPASPIMAPAY